MKKIAYLSTIASAIFLLTAFSPVEKGDKVPDFSALDENGETWKLSDQRSNYLVIYFYPAAFTGGCTKQACSYRDHKAGYSKLKASVVGISGDEYENLGAFKVHHDLNFTLLSDVDGKIAEIFGVPAGEGKTFETEVEGKTLQLTRGVTTSRWTFVVDGNGKLIYKDNEVSAATDPETVLKFIATYDGRKSCVQRN
ncbi:peroxiredoxin [Bacteroidota bacterium]